MTTSGTTTFNYNRDQIIRRALRLIGAIASSEVPDAQTVQDSADALNAMVKRWMANGLHLWTTVEAVMFVQIGQVQYTLGPNSTDHAAQVYTQTQLLNSVANGAGTIQVVSTTNIVNGVGIGVTLNSGDIFWSTVSSISANNVNLSQPLPDSAYQFANVYVTSPNIDRPLRIPAARRWNSISGIETPLMPLSRLDYEALPDKLQTGEVTQFYYNPQGGAVNVGALFLWPAPQDTTTNSIKFTYYRPIQDFDTAGNTPDLPVEWIDTIVFNLALSLALEYDCPPQRYTMIKEQALVYMDEVSGWDKEDTSAYFGVDFSQSSYNH